MIDPKHRLPISKQAKALGINRGSVYYLPRTAPAADLKVMRLIDELHLDYPFAGSRMLQAFLAREGFDVGRLHVATLMKRIGIKAIYRRLSIPVEISPKVPTENSPVRPVRPSRRSGHFWVAGLADVRGRPRLAE